MLCAGATEESGVTKPTPILETELRATIRRHNLLAALIDANATLAREIPNSPGRGPAMVRAGRSLSEKLRPGEPHDQA